MSAEVTTWAPNLDNPAEALIREALRPNALKSFILTAGAGSGKTGSLSNVLRHIQETYREHFMNRGERVAVLTFTNAACTEIASRVNQHPLFQISTIHSFCWEQIKSFQSDIQDFLKTELPLEIAELQEKQRKGRAGKAALDRERGIASRSSRLEWLSEPRRFSYSPNGDNFGRDSLTHNDVIRITSRFIVEKPSMKAILAQRYPIMLIDEVQDTNKYLLDALLSLEDARQGHFALGLFGDTMQRIYFDGKAKLMEAIPERWERPVKRMNHRSPKRIIQLANKLRASVDGHEQVAPSNSSEGIVRLFLAPSTTPDKKNVEARIRRKMAEISKDEEWDPAVGRVKALTLEHHMAASRMGFFELFSTLDKDPKSSTGLRTGDLAGLRLFTELVAPIVNAPTRSDPFRIMSLLRNASPLLNKERIARASKNSADPLSELREAVRIVQSLDVESAATTFLDVLQAVSLTGLFEIPSILKPYVQNDAFTEIEQEDASQDDEETDDPEQPKLTKQLESWRRFLETPYKQIQPYIEYVSGEGEFGTHQGVKGLEFDRVLVIMDDSASRGFQFSYGKLFGIESSSKRSVTNSDELADDTSAQTRRLMYVTCTRARKSLALVAYTNSPEKLRASVTADGWFAPEEIEDV